MSSDVNIEKLVKKLDDHEKRIINLEKSRIATTDVSPRKAIISKGMSIFDSLSQLKSEGFFDQPRFLADIVEKFAEKGYHYPSSSLTEPMQRAIRQGMLGRLRKNGKWTYVKR